MAAMDRISFVLVMGWLLEIREMGPGVNAVFDHSRFGGERKWALGDGRTVAHINSLELARTQPVFQKGSFSGALQQTHG